MKILEIKKLSKKFGEKNILDDVNFELDVGECLGIVGKSGCGKSTTVKIITKLLEADEGEIILEGKDITHEKNLKEIYAKMQMIFQNPEESFNPRKTIGWSVGEALRNQKYDNVKERVKKLLCEVGLNEEYFDRYPHEISGGECQRAAIARALSINPKILICDEATSALDVSTQSKIIKLIKKFSVEKKIACIFITHDLSILSEIADKVIVMNEGKIVEIGEVKEIIKNPQSIYTKELIEAAFF